MHFSNLQRLKMGILAGNIGSNILSGIQYKVFSTHWVNRSRGILCLKGREYGSAASLPNNSHRAYDTEASLPFKGSDKAECGSNLDASVSNKWRGTPRSMIYDANLRNRRGIGKHNSLCDDAEQELGKEIYHDFGARDHGFMEEVEEIVDEIKVNEGEGTCNQDVMRIDRTTTEAAEKLAVELLAVRAFTAVELKKKLHAKKFPSDIVEGVVNNFRSRGLINDSLYAESFSQSRWSSSSWGPRRIKQALFSKGVSQTDAENAVKLVFEDGQSEEDQQLIHGLSKLSMDRLYVQASKQWLRGQDLPKEKRKPRVVRWLQYRGFNWGVISYVLKKLESEYPL